MPRIVLDSSLTELSLVLGPCLATVDQACPEMQALQLYLHNAVLEPQLFASHQQL